MFEDDQMALGKRIEDRLNQLGWKRRDLIESVRGIELSEQALSNLIRRDSKRSEHDEAIAEALGVSVLWLVYGHESNYVKNSPNTKVLEYRASEPKGREILINTLFEIVQTLSEVSIAELIGHAKQMSANSLPDKTKLVG
jgi:hypothetical protein